MINIYKIGGNDIKFHVQISLHSRGITNVHDTARAQKVITKNYADNVNYLKIN